MATLLTQWGVDSASTSTTSLVTNPIVNLPVGTTLVLGVSCAVPATTAISVTDSGGNTWTKTQARASGAGEDVVLASVVLTAALTTASTITVTFGNAATRICAAVAAFSDAVTTPKTHGSFLETSGTTVTGGNVTPAAASIVFGASGFVSSGRTFAPAAGWTAGDKHLSTVGAGDRAVGLVWCDGTASTTYNTIGTISPSGAVMMTCLGHVATGAVTPPPGATAKVWDGSKWVLGNPKVWDGSKWVLGKAKVM